MTRSEVLAMTTAKSRRYARRVAKEPYGTVRLEQVQDIRQGPVTGRREGYTAPAWRADSTTRRAAGGSARCSTRAAWSGPRATSGRPATSDPQRRAASAARRPEPPAGG